MVVAHSFSCRALKSSSHSRTISLPSFRAHKASSFQWHSGVRHSLQPVHPRLADKSRCSIFDQPSPAADILHEQDTNRLTTALNTAINAEDYRLAAQIRDRLTELAGNDSEATADWTKLGIPLWLAERAERLGYRFPTGDASQPCKKYAMQIRLLRASGPIATPASCCNKLSLQKLTATSVSVLRCIQCCRAAEARNPGLEQQERHHCSVRHRIGEDARLCDAPPWVSNEIPTRSQPRRVPGEPPHLMSACNTNTAACCTAQCCCLHLLRACGRSLICSRIRE